MSEKKEEAQRHAFVVPAEPGWLGVSLAVREGGSNVMIIDVVEVAFWTIAPAPELELPELRHFAELEPAYAWMRAKSTGLSSMSSLFGFGGNLGALVPLDKKKRPIPDLRRLVPPDPAPTSERVARVLEETRAWLTEAGRLATERASKAKGAP